MIITPEQIAAIKAERDRLLATCDADTAHAYAMRVTHDVQAEADRLIPPDDAPVSTDKPTAFGYKWGRD